MWSADGRQLAGPSVKRDGEVVLDVITPADDAVRRCAPSRARNVAPGPDLVAGRDAGCVTSMRFTATLTYPELWTMRLSRPYPPLA